MTLRARLGGSLGRGLSLILPAPLARGLVEAMVERDRDRRNMIDLLLHHQKARAPALEDMPFDLPIEGALGFEHMAGLFAGTTLDESIAMMNVRQVAYLFGLIRETRPERVIEIGRHKGGTTLAIAAAMAGRGRFWSIDDPGRTDEGPGRPVQDQLADMCRRLGLSVTMVDGDPRNVELDSGEVDLVFIDGDHAYESCRSDFERFGTRVRVGGSVLFDDAFDDGFYRPPHTLDVERVAREVGSRRDFRLVKAVKRLAHFERIA